MNFQDVTAISERNWVELYDEEFRTYVVRSDSDGRPLEKYRIESPVALSFGSGGRHRVIDAQGMEHTQLADGRFMERPFKGNPTLKKSGKGKAPPAKKS